MKNMSKFVQGFAVILFATTSIASFGISEEEKTIIKNGKFLNEIQEIEASSSFKLAEFASQHYAFPLYLGITLGLTNYFICLFLNNNHAKFSSITGGLVGTITGGFYQQVANKHIETVEKAKKDTLLRRKNLMSALKEQALKKS